MIWPIELQEMLDERLRKVPGPDPTIRSNELALGAVFSGYGLWSEFYLTPTGDCIIYESFPEDATTRTTHRYYLVLALSYLRKKDQRFEKFLVRQADEKTCICKTDPEIAAKIIWQPGDCMLCHGNG